MLLEAGWLDQVAVPDPWYQSPAVTAAAAATATVCVALLSSPHLCCLCSTHCQHNSTLLLQFIISFPLYLYISYHLPALSFPSSVSNVHTDQAVADRRTVQALLWMASSCTSGGSVRSSVALQTVSIVLRMTHSSLQRMADGQTAQCKQADRSAEPTVKQRRDWQWDGWFVTDTAGAEADCLPIQKRPATCRYGHRIRDRWVTFSFIIFSSLLAL